MSYDHWKTTEPEPQIDPPAPEEPTELDLVHDELREARKLIKEMLDAIETGNIDSPDISATDEPHRRWHEEWAHRVRRQIVPSPPKDQS